MLPNSKSNRITVGNERYRYVVAEVGSVSGSVVPLTVTVQHQENGAHLRVSGLTTTRVPENQSKFYMGRTVSQNIEPRHIAQLIKLALSRGWIPGSSGPAFILQVANTKVFPVATEG